MLRRGRSRAASVLVTGLLVALVPACSNEKPQPAVDGAVIQPGRPGEKSETLDEAPRIEAAEANDADLLFAQMMIPHHAQALQMSELAEDAGAGEDVAVLADRIAGAQKPEIVFMASWLDEQGVDAPTQAEIDAGLTMGDHAEHGMDEGDVGAMPGMATEQQMRLLADARGTTFDTLFLQLMIRHHRGAIDMASTVLRDGSEQQVNELATGIAADQSAEISRMEDLLATLG